jgi:hypothetical protein
VKNQFDKYKYLGDVIPEVPETWNNIILNMLADIDYLVKPKWVPRWLINIHLPKETKFIIKIKQSFGTLRVKHKFTDENIKNVISTAEKLCNNTCEFCGKEGTSQVTIKNWVRNICPECIEKHKK